MRPELGSEWKVLLSREPMHFEHAVTDDGAGLPWAKARLQVQLAVRSVDYLMHASSIQSATVHRKPMQAVAQANKTHITLHVLHLRSVCSRPRIWGCFPQSIVHHLCMHHGKAIGLAPPEHHVAQAEHLGGVG